MSDEMWRVQYRDDDERDRRLIASLNARIEELEAALQKIEEGYGPNHGSIFCLNTACAALQAKGE